MVDTIYMPLLGEGVDVCRPVPAEKVGDATYVVRPTPDYDPELETWQFPPGSTVVCQPRKTADGVVLAAVGLREQRKQSA